MEPVDSEVVRFAAGDGTMLEGDLHTPADPVARSVVCHPHPLYGGNRHDAVVAALTRGLLDARHRVLAFDFRGTGGSEGAHDGGDAERGDLRAAIDRVDPDLGPLVIAGYSFGADVALAVTHPTAVGWIVAAPPFSIVPVADMAAPTDPRPVHLLVGAHDQFNPVGQVVEATESWTNVHVHPFPGADHFFAGSHRAIAASVAAIAAELG